MEYGRAIGASVFGAGGSQTLRRIKLEESNRPDTQSAVDSAWAPSATINPAGAGFAVSEPIAARQIRVLIADDHAVLREGLKLYLQNCGMEVVGVASNGREAVEMSSELEPDVLLLDIRMPVMDGLQALAEIKAVRPGINVIMLTAYPTREHVTESFRNGASGFLAKTTDVEHVPAAIQIVAAGDAIVDRELLQGAMQALSEPAKPAAQDLDLRELELTYQEQKVLKLIAAGLENRRIADQLSISHNTIKTHMRNIYSKLGVSDRTQAAIWAMRNGLAD